jgi:DNA-binding transcriptional MocR family regulator
MITRSIEQAIDLVARTLLSPGDVVAVEAFGYPPAWNVLKLAGARLVPLPLDGEGLDIDALEGLLPRENVRAVFLTPHHQFPTTAVMSRSRRARLAELALQHRFAIIEDDYDHEFHYAGKPVLPIAAGNGRANVVYVGSLANLLAPGISTAFVTAPAAVFERPAQPARRERCAQRRRDGVRHRRTVRRWRGVASYAAHAPHIRGPARRAGHDVDASPRFSPDVPRAGWRHGAVGACR